MDANAQPVQFFQVVAEKAKKDAPGEVRVLLTTLDGGQWYKLNALEALQLAAKLNEFAANELTNERVSMFLDAWEQEAKQKKTTKKKTAKK